MRPAEICRAIVGLVLGFAVSSGALAQFAVIDATSVAQLVRQSASLTQQLATARAQLQQLQSEYLSLTGSRGMENLLAGSVRNYLPADWDQLDALAGGRPGGFTSLAMLYGQGIQANAVLNESQLDAFAPADRSALQARRSAAAMREAVARSALSRASARFDLLQHLIGALSTASDAKAALDLQARIGAEQGMLTNEQIKLQTLFQAQSARSQALDLQGEEAALALQGRFSGRFEPVPH